MNANKQQNIRSDAWDELPRQAGRRTDNRRTDNRRTDNRRTDNRRTDNRRTDNRRTDNRRTDNRRTDNRRTGEQARRQAGKQICRRTDRQRESQTMEANKQIAIPHIFPLVSTLPLFLFTFVLLQSPYLNLPDKRLPFEVGSTALSPPAKAS
ncbi:hypothetical protein K440DRAFT_360129 [Wilcoxina mikolae CBS 423.85]|nr:hypothetical protein K440DRAFT_360129 [Wilcoxina mikolae CBS 423.85]